MIMTRRLLAPVPADAGGSVAARSVVAAAEITAERRRGATIDVGDDDEIEARALAAFEGDLDGATPAGRAIMEARALVVVEEAIEAALLKPA